MKLHEKLLDYGNSENYPFHMPGHKRNKEYLGSMLPYEIDITEINGFDDLHHAEGIIQEMEMKAAKLFKSDKTYCLINGSTIGNIAAILGVTNYGDKILISRNSHKSVHSAIELNNLKPIYVYPENIHEFGMCGEIDPKSVERILENEKDIKACVIVSPTYEGVVSNITKIAEITHKHSVPLIVDEAHGAHLGLHNYFPSNSNQCGADIVVHSIHKTLPAPTQTALLHVNGKLVDKAKVKKYLSMLQSSSPSYILLAGISRCLELLEENIETQINEYIENIEYSRMKLKSMRNLRLVETERYDKGKIVISTENTMFTSKNLFNQLRDRYSLELEMDGLSYVIAMTSVADTKEGLDRLTNALIEIDKSLEEFKEIDFCQTITHTGRQDDIYLEQKAFHDEMEKRSINDNSRINKSIAEIFVEEGLVKNTSGEKSEHYYYLYPPGIPLIVPGEVITDRHKILMLALEKRDYVIRKI